jgi:hypothetical protein
MFEREGREGERERKNQAPLTSGMNGVIPFGWVVYEINAPPFQISNDDSYSKSSSNVQNAFDSLRLRSESKLDFDPV